jgi:hypothetical protein
MNLKNTAEIQGFVERLIDSSDPITSTAKSEANDVAGTTNFDLVRTVENGLTQTKILRRTFNANVPAGTILDAFDSPQDFIDTVIAFLSNEANDVEVDAGVITNTRIEA